jgi:hypothetical protein
MQQASGCLQPDGLSEVISRLEKERDKAIIDAYHLNPIEREKMRNEVREVFEIRIRAERAKWELGVRTVGKRSVCESRRRRMKEEWARWRELPCLGRRGLADSRRPRRWQGGARRASERSVPVRES